MNIPSDASDFKPRQRGLHRLTDRAAKALARSGRHADGGGLYIEVRPTGTKAWLFISKQSGRQRVIGLGGYPGVTLAAAREKAAAIRADMASGRDPFAERKREAQPVFGEAARRYVEAKGSGWRNRKTRFQWEVALADHCKPIWNTRVSEVDVETVLGVVKPLWNQIPVSAARVRNRIELVLDFAKAHGWRSGENPARWRGGLAHLLPRPVKTEVRHYPAIRYNDLPALMARLRDISTMTARALEFTVLTAVRSGEARLATWDELDLDSALWTIPANRMKANRAHVVPLPDTTVVLLRGLRRLGLPGDYVFAGQKRSQPIGDSSVLKLLHRLLPDAKVTAHGMRSCFADWAADTTTFQREVIEQSLAHAIGNVTERSYRRGSALQKRRQLIQAWSDFATGAKAPVASNVVPMANRRR